MIAMNSYDDDSQFIEHILQVNLLQQTLQHFACRFGQTALCSLHFFKRSLKGARNFWKHGQITSLRAMFLHLYKKFFGSLTSPANQYQEDAREGAYN